MDSRNENVTSSNSASYSETERASGVPEGYRRSTAQPRATSTPQQDERGPTAEFAQSEQSLQPMGSLAEIRWSTSVDYQSDVSGSSRGSPLVHRPTTAPPVPQDLMSEPLSQAFSVCQIDLATRRIRVMKATHSSAAAEGHFLDPADVARAAAAVQMEDLQEAETKSVTPAAENLCSHPRGPSAGREPTMTGTEPSSRTIGGGTGSSRSDYTDEDDTQTLPFEHIRLAFGYIRYYLSRGHCWFRRYRLEIIWSVAIVGGLIGFILLGLLLSYIRQRNRTLAITPTESEAETTTPFHSGHYDKNPPWIMPFF